MTNYDPKWLIEAAQQSIDQHPWLPAALAKCNKIIDQRDAYIYFVSSENPNQAGSEWQFQENIILRNTENGDVVLDILKDNRVGGVEFLNKI